MRRKARVEGAAKRDCEAEDFVISTLRKAVSEVGPNVPVDQIETMKQIVSGSVAQSRFRNRRDANFRAAGFVCRFDRPIRHHELFYESANARVRHSRGGWGK